MFKAYLPMASPSILQYDLNGFLKPPLKFAKMGY